MMLPLWLGVAMAIEAETMKASFGADLETRGRAAVTVNAGIESTAIDVVMVADQAVDRRVLTVIEVQRKRLRGI